MNFDEIIECSNVDECYYHYTGQLKQLRKMISNKIGVEKTSEMSDKEIVSEIKNMGYIPMHIGLNDEDIFLVDKETFDKMKYISR